MPPAVPSHERRHHAHDAADLARRIDVAIADGRQRDDRPVDGVEKRVKAVGLHLKHDERRQRDIPARQHTHRRERSFLALDDIQNKFKAVRVAQEFERLERFVEAEKPKQLEPRRQHRQRRQDGQQVYNTEKAERIAQKRPFPALFVL